MAKEKNQKYSVLEEGAEWFQNGEEMRNEREIEIEKEILMYFSWGWRKICLIIFY